MTTTRRILPDHPNERTQRVTLSSLEMHDKLERKLGRLRRKLNKMRGDRSYEVRAARVALRREIREVRIEQLGYTKDYLIGLIAAMKRRMKEDTERRKAERLARKAEREAVEKARPKKKRKRSKKKAASKRTRPAKT